MKFNTAKEMLKTIQDGDDLYCRETEMIVWLYNDSGSIAYGYVSPERLATWVDDNIPGYIVDDPSYEGYDPRAMTNLEWCEDNLNLDWEVV